MPNPRPPVRADMSFAEFLASRPIRPNGWGDFVRTSLASGSLPHFRTWDDLRHFVEHYRDFDIRVPDARAAWRAYSTMLRTAERKSSRPQFMDGMPVPGLGESKIMAGAAQPTYEQLQSPEDADEAVLVSVFSAGGKTFARVERRLLIVAGSVAAAETDGPLTVPDALEEAERVLEACRPYGLTKIVVRLDDNARWQPQWGKLVRYPPQLG